MTRLLTVGGIPLLAMHKYAPMCNLEEEKREKKKKQKKEYFENKQSEMEKKSCIHWKYVPVNARNRERRPVDTGHCECRQHVKM